MYIFSYKNEINQNIYLKNSPIPLCKTIRILGIIFDVNFNWIFHLKQLKSSCKIEMNVIKTLAPNIQKANEKSLLIIYKFLILSKMNYGSIIYYTAEHNLFKLLYPIYNEGICLLIGTYRTSPIDNILNYAEEIPLQLQKTKTH